MSATVEIRRARPEEAEELSGLAVRSKAHWGYSAEFIESCRSELSVEAHQFQDPGFECFAAVVAGSIVGFYSIQAVSKTEYELEALFVEPQQIGSGVGRELVTHAIEVLSKKGAKTLVIQGDPHAAGFYLAVGAREMGERESESIPGRYLPLFEIPIGTTGDESI